MRRRHGGDLAAFFKAYPDAEYPIIDLSTGINPWPYPWRDRVPDEVLEASIQQLPDAGAAAACKATVAAYYGSDDLRRWTLGPGSQAIIERLPSVIEPAQVYVVEPTYSEHRYVWERAGHEVIGIPHGVLLKKDCLPDSLVVVVNPNNPDGQTTEPSALLDLAMRLQEGNSRLLVDEAFVDLQPRLGLAQYTPPDNAMVIRSFGKFFGLAGLRLGALFGAPELVSAMERVSHLWEVNGLALAIATYAVSDLDWIDATRRALASHRAALDEALSGAPVTVVGGTDLFVLVQSDDAQALRDHLAGDGIYVRDFDDQRTLLRMGLPPDDPALERLHRSIRNFRR